MPLFDGKVAIVTGGSSGIGQAACHLYAREGTDEYLMLRTVPQRTDLRQVKLLNTVL